MKARALAAMAFAVVVSAASAGFVREIEVKMEPEQDGQRDVTVRIMPDVTREYDRLVIECVYHQEFPWEDVTGKKITKIHEPVFFTYARPAVKLVNDLDAYVSFRLPVSLNRLQQTYGPKVFNAAYPITVPRLRIAAESGGKAVWSYTVPSEGKADLAAAATSPASDRIK
jgi:hypothetical protein